VAVRIRMKKLGRKHRPFFRICATDGRSPRDGRTIEELGTYDPSVPDVDARAVLNHDRVAYWLGVGAQPSVNVSALIKKYGPNGTHLELQRAARERLAMPKIVPPTPEPVALDPPPAPPQAEEAPAAEATTDESATAEPAAAEPTVDESPAAE